MPSASDFYNELKNTHTDLNNKLDGVASRLDGVNNRLDAVKAAVDAVRGAVDKVDQRLQWGFHQLIVIGNYTNQALFHNNLQNDTMICILEHISKNTCELVNEAHLQTGLQTTIKNNTTALADLYAATHADAALARERLEALRKQMEECCPPKTPPPVCDYQPCPKPDDRIGRPPVVDPGREPRPPG